MSNRNVTIKLPWPPSINHYMGNRVAGRRVIRYIGAKGKTFRQEVENIVTKQLGDFPTLLGDLHVEIEIYQPDKRKRDIDNLLKAPLDALQHAGVYEDDHQIASLKISRSNEIIKPGCMIVNISEVNNYDES